jgi:hypothetical protein
MVWTHYHQHCQFLEKTSRAWKNCIPHVCVATPTSNLSFLDRVHKCNFRMMVVACVTCVIQKRKNWQVYSTCLSFFCRNREINLCHFQVPFKFFEWNFLPLFCRYLIFFIYLYLFVYSSHDLAMQWLSDCTIRSN